jgi:hypothetical protein
MVSDPGFRRTMIEDLETLKNMEASVKADRNFVMGHTGVASIPMKRG